MRLCIEKLNNLSGLKEKSEILPHYNPHESILDFSIIFLIFFFFF